ncbi:hypothetical protein H257_18591 [Aphanomyces astaci]|uniref:Uncharacterized protein n=1 Tax=Aphanomyces astaci TaxID=112090 RepID=W4FAP4_APHAT|nr:hypothetical protein H257_18591 [Aphanomyces astaci]ETV64532.1 hypothetical protein H257_18591 [Aphanomyces astaci]|eukprot:XP_009845986.1 hypothetical protein H257_18591 [Aphanomyces astaci]
MLNNLRATLAKSGYTCRCTFHHASGSTRSWAAASKYIFKSPVGWVSSNGYSSVHDDVGGGTAGVWDEAAGDGDGGTNTPTPRLDEMARWSVSSVSCFSDGDRNGRDLNRGSNAHTRRMGDDCSVAWSSGTKADAWGLSWRSFTTPCNSPNARDARGGHGPILGSSEVLAICSSNE